MAIIVDKFVEDIKELISKRDDLRQDLKPLKSSLVKGKSYFRSPENSSKEALLNGTNRVIEIMDEIIQKEKEIYDLDLIIASKLEMYLGNFIAKAKVHSKVDDTGTTIKPYEALLVPFSIGEPYEITPDDIWFLKMVRAAYKANNIQIIEK